MINLCRFSKIPFGDLVNLPNYYIHEIYKSYVEDYKIRVKKEKEEEAKRQSENGRTPQSITRDSSTVANLRQMLSGQSGLNGNDLEDLMSEIEDEI